MISIKQATLSDADILSNMAIEFRNHNQKTQPTDEDFRRGVTRLLSGSDATFFIAYSGSTPCGYVLLRYRFSMWANGIDASLEDLFVAESSRRLGIGKLLVEQALQHLHSLGVAEVHLDTNENNPASNKIYQQLGFSCISKRWNGRQLFYRKAL